MIIFDNVSFSYSDKNLIFKNLSFSLNKGEVLLILGKNGTGKSTFVKVLAGILPYDGKILLDNKDVRENKFLLRQKIAFIFQDIDSYFVSSIVEDDVRFSLENLGIPEKEIEKRLNWVFSYLQIKDLRYRVIDSLSGGQKQKVAIAGVLALKPDFIVFDESFSMLDIRSRKNIIGLILKLSKQLNIGIIIITHFLDDIELADKLLVFSNKNIKYYSNIREYIKDNLTNRDFLPYYINFLLDLKERKVINLNLNKVYKSHEILRNLIEFINW